MIECRLPPPLGIYASFSVPVSYTIGAREGSSVPVSYTIGHSFAFPNLSNVHLEVRRPFSNRTLFLSPRTFQIEISTSH